jgi:hypothetical protein
VKQVNIHLPGTLPKSQINFMLAHQMALLIMLYDQEVDFELSSVGGAGSAQSIVDNAGGKVGLRVVRGRDRRKPIAWNERHGTFEYRF